MNNPRLSTISKEFSTQNPQIKTEILKELGLNDTDSFDDINREKIITLLETMRNTVATMINGISNTVIINQKALLDCNPNEIGGEITYHIGRLQEITVILNALASGKKPSDIFGANTPPDMDNTQKSITEKARKIIAQQGC